MRNWVLSSNPTTTYRAEKSLRENDEMDWISRNRFEVGDIVYIYEVLPPNGRGGIICKTIVTETGLTLDNKIDDREFWVGGDYPDYITSEARFNKLKSADAPNNGIIPFRDLKEQGFFAPQIGASSLDKKPNLLKYVERHFE